MTHIRIVSPAKAIEKNRVESAKKWLESKGFEVSVGQYTLNQEHYFSERPKNRLFDFQSAINDPKVDIILCARGGYGSVHIIDDIDFSLLGKKIIAGFSDITVFHTHLNQIGIPSLHSTMPLNFEENSSKALQSLIDAFEHKPLKYSIAANTLNIQGEAKGELIGGNLAILHALNGTNSDCGYANKILFFEEVGEYIYSIDRMLWTLKKANKFKHLKGVIVGGLTNIKDTETPFGKSVEEVILSHFSDLKIPVCFGFPAGHIQDNRAVYLGKETKLSVSKNGVLFEQLY